MDIDIDVPSSFDRKKIFPGNTLASMIRDGNLTAHPAGLYFQPVPKDPVTGISAVPYKDAEELGFSKIDFLHLTILDHFESKEEVRALAKMEPDWSLMQREDVTAKLFQLSKHHNLITKAKPKSIMDVAECIALIRPGKSHLITTYLYGDRNEVRRKLWIKPKDDRAYYKKPHAISYAIWIAIQLNMVAAGINI